MKLLQSQQQEACPDFSSSMEKTSMEGVDIMPMDVLCGRGKNSFNHVGNRKFRDIVADAIPGYVTATSRATKSEIVTSIVRKVRESGGRFLKRDNDRKVWYVLNYTQSKEKAGHAIRDATITEESKKQRARKRKLMRAAASANNNNNNTPTSTPTTSMTPRRVSVEPTTSMGTVVTPQAVQPIRARKTSTSTKGKGRKSSPALVSPEPEFQQVPQCIMKDLTNDIKTLDDESSPIECLSSMLMAHFPEKLFPEEMPSSASFEPIPIDDPFNSYIDQLLGPLTDIAELVDF